MVEPPTPKPPVAPSPVPAPVVVAPKPPVATKPALKKKSSSTKALLIAGAIVLLALGIGGYLLVRSVQKQTPKETETSQPVSQTTTTETPTSEAPTETPTPETQSPFPKAATPGVDTDSDGLTDTEENLVYGTNPQLPDTDGDGFLDGNEVFHGYDPNSTVVGATLLNSKVVQALDAQNFRMVYPSKWVLQPAEAGSYKITAGTGEEITVGSVEKPKDQSLTDWYVLTKQETAPTITKTKTGLPMIVSKDQLTSYVDLGSSVLVVVYNTQTKGTIDYLQTIKMMQNRIEPILGVQPKP